MTESDRLLRFHPSQLAKGPLTVAEELPAAALELQEAAAEANGPIQVEFTARADGRNVIVEGQANTTVRLKCGRCCEWREWPLATEPFTLILEDAMTRQHHSVEIFPQVREELLLQLPLNAVCQLDAQGKCPYDGKAYPLPGAPEVPLAGDDPWKALDQIRPKP